MAKGGTKTKAGPKYAPRRVKSAEDRNAGRGQFITLKSTNDQFLGYALFKPDPELADNPGYYEYFEHYTPATGYCPCAGDDCPLCAEGDNPSTRAKTMWLVSKDGKDVDPDNCEVKIFTMNWSVIQEFVDYLSDDEPILGQLWRVKRLEGKGKFSLRLKDKKLTKAQIKAALKESDDDLLEKLATKQLNRVLEELDVEAAMNDDDDDDDNDEEEATSKSRKGKPADKGKGKGKKDEEPDDDDDDDEGFDHENEDEAEDVTVDVVKVTKSKNILKVKQGDGDEFELYGTEDVDLTDFSKGDSITFSAAKDDDGDWVVSEVEEAEAEEEPEEEEAEGEPPATFEGVVTIKSVNNDEDTLTVVTEDDVEFDLFFLADGEDDNGKDWSELDFDDFEEDQKVTIVAAKDDDGDMLASAFPEAEKKGKGKGTTKGKGKGKKK